MEPSLLQQQFLALTGGIQPEAAFEYPTDAGWFLAAMRAMTSLDCVANPSAGLPPADTSISSGWLASADC